MFAVLGWFYLSVLPGWLGLPQTSITASPWQIAKSVLIFLGIPPAGRLSLPAPRRTRQRTPGGTRSGSFPPSDRGRSTDCCSPSSFSSRYRRTDHHPPWDVARIALPLLAYFAIMWGGGYLLGAALHLGYPRTTTLAFTAAATTSNWPSPSRSPPGATSRSGAGRRGRPAHRGSRSGSAGLRLPRPTTTLPR